MYFFTVSYILLEFNLWFSNKSHAPSLGSVGCGGGGSSPGGKKPERRLRSSPRNSEPETHAQGRTNSSTKRIMVHTLLTEDGEGLQVIFPSSKPCIDYFWIALLWQRQTQWYTHLSKWLIAPKHHNITFSVSIQGTCWPETKPAPTSL